MNKPRIIISPLHHRGAQRIKVECPFDEVVISQIKKIEGRLWSKTHSCWHVPYSAEAYQQLKEMFEVEVPDEFLKKETNQKILTPTFRTIKTENGNFQIVTGNKIIVEHLHEKWLKAFVPGDKKNWVEIIKTIPGRKWDSDGKYWHLPIVQETLEILGGFDSTALQMPKNIPSGLPLKFKTRKRPIQSKSPLNKSQTLALTALEERLILEFKSHKTIKSYRYHIAALLRYYPLEKPSQISLHQIEQFILYKRREKNIAASTLNIMINALNAFFGRMLGQEEKVVQIQRPKKDRSLPNYASEQEIKALLNAAENAKHKCMLLLIYAAGLRKGELLNLRKRDLNKFAQTLFVKGGKGRKDRYTFYSPTAIKYIEAYMKAYKSSYWLFEGQSGGKYSETSLQSIFEKAKKASGVNERLTLHGLRHSFATHLVYKGVPLHEVKQLLGHESIKTTEVYLHLSSRYNKQIESPLEGLDL